METQARIFGNALAPHRSSFESVEADQIARGVVCEGVKDFLTQMNADIS